MVASMYAVRNKGDEDGFNWFRFYAHCDEEAAKIIGALKNQWSIEHGEFADLTTRRRVWVEF